MTLRILPTWLGVVVAIVVAGCARLPYQTTTVYQGQRAAVVLQREVEPAGYSHPTQFRADELTAILRGFSIREQQRLPLRWFAEERPPDRLFQEEELTTLTPFLVEGFQKAGTEERVHFAVFAPGKNQAEARTVTSGWAAVRDAHLYLTIEYLHAEVPIQSVDHYFPNNPHLPPLPGFFLLFFEPGRYWVMDRARVRALEYREFLKTAPLAPPRASSPRS